MIIVKNTEKPIDIYSQEHFKGTPLEGRVEIEERNGYCPIQVEGKIDGYAFYFRMRDRVELYISYNRETEPLDIVPIFGSEPGFFSNGCWIRSQEYPEMNPCIDYPGRAEEREVVVALRKALSVYDANKKTAEQK